MLSYEREPMTLEHNGRKSVTCYVRGAARDGTVFEASWVEFADHAHPFAHRRCSQDVLKAIAEHDALQSK